VSAQIVIDYTKIGCYHADRLRNREILEAGKISDMSRLQFTICNVQCAIMVDVE